MQQELDEANKLLEPLEKLDLPPFLLAIHWMLRASTQIGYGDARQAQAFIEQGVRPCEDMPIWHYLRAQASNMLGKPREAVVHVRRYLDVIGEDAEAYAVLGTVRTIGT
jgi:predicted Zn-dependent protease